MTRVSSAAGRDRLYQAMSARVAHGELPGLVVLVAHGDDVQVDAIGETAFGSAEPMRRNAIFRIASLTKPVLATATMLLVEDGSLGLDEPVDRLLPELANRRVLRRIDGPLDDTMPAERPITVEDLLSLRMGFGQLVEPTFNPPFPIVKAADQLQLVLGPPDPRTQHTPDEWIKLFATLPLMYQPGQRWHYNVGSLVLGVLVARAAGQPLAEVLRRRIFEPLGMRETGFSLPAGAVDRMPSYYMTDFQTGAVELQTLSSPEEWTRPPAFPSGAGGLVSTIDDFLAFGRLLLDRGVYRGRRLVSEKSVELLTTNRLTPDQIAGGGPILGGQGWGLGMGVITAPSESTSSVGSYGWGGGYGTAWFNDPAKNLVAIAMTQTVGFLFNGGLEEFTKLADQ
jgi:CubicO group peptidase (beta-lactamase class C family)